MVDESPNPQQPGRICRPALVDECRLGKHDCHKDAVCLDEPRGFTCQCNLNTVDASADMALKPGRMCVPKPTPKPDNCRQNECHPAGNIDVIVTYLYVLAECISQSSGYSCKCRTGFKDIKGDGRDCRPLINECQFEHLNDCALNARCVDLDEGFKCVCNDGLKDMNPQRPGTVCKQLLNECANPSTNSCDKNSLCIDREDGYTVSNQQATN